MSTNRFENEKSFTNNNFSRKYENGVGIGKLTTNGFDNNAYNPLNLTDIGRRYSNGNMDDKTLNNSEDKYRKTGQSVSNSHTASIGCTPLNNRTIANADKKGHFVSNDIKNEYPNSIKNGNTRSFSLNSIQTPLHLPNGATLAADLASVNNHENFYTYELLKGIADWLLQRVDIRPTIGIICGSGMGPLADMITESTTFPYEKIPHFPQSTVPGHPGRLVFGKLCDVPVMCMQGRFHYYEGYPLWKCSMPVRVMNLVGVKNLIVTNAAGGLHPEYNTGDIMIIKDHVNLMGFAGNNPLQGVNEERFGPRFIAMNRAYDLKFRNYAKQIATDIGVNEFVREGVYAVLGGPSFETPAELRLLKTCGVDAVGMSTVHEVLMAYHAGMKIFAFSLITNKCIMDYDETHETNHAEVIDTGKMREPVLKELVTRMVMKIDESEMEDENKLSAP